MSDWRKAAGVLRGAIPPGETPEALIRRLRDEPTDAERALAVLDRLSARWPKCSLTIWRADDGYDAHGFWDRDGDGMISGIAHGPTPAAALLALGAQLEGDDGGE